VFVGNPITVQEKVRYLFFHYLRNMENCVLSISS